MFTLIAAVPRLRFGWTVAVASSAGFSAKELGDVLRVVQAHQKQLLEAWHDFFGKGGDG
jgi:hypothetical protein